MMLEGLATGYPAYMARIEREHQIAMCAISATAVEKDRPLANATICCPVVRVQNDSGFIFGGNGGLHVQIRNR
jgi:hypothetical protein